MIFAEQQFPIEKSEDPVEMGGNIIVILNELGVTPEYFISDNTGNALLLCGYLKRVFGDILTVCYSQKATDLKILDEIQETAYELYDGIDTEMWFATAEWMKFGYFKISRAMDTSTLFTELHGRTYKRPNVRAKLSSKLDFKSATGLSSPDFSDSLTQLTQLCRMRGSENPKMLPQPPQQRRETIDRRWTWEPPESEIEEGDEGSKYVVLD